MDTTTLVFRVEGMHCGSCALLIDETLEDLPGVREATTSRRKGRSTVEVDPDRCTLEDVTTAIAALGYRAIPEEGTAR